MAVNDALNMNEKVTVINLAGYNISFPNIIEKGETLFTPYSKRRIRREEIEAQITSGNRLLGGLDSYGSHASLFIDDAPTREYFEFDSKDGSRKQNIISNEKVKAWFETKGQSTFEKKIQQNVKTMTEKTFLLKAIDDLKLDSYGKITFCNQYCRLKTEF